MDWKQWFFITIMMLLISFIGIFMGFAFSDIKDEQMCEAGHLEYCRENNSEMDQCKLTYEQILALANRQKVQVSYSTLEEYGRVDRHEIELIPPEFPSIQLLTERDICDENNCS